MIRRIDVNQADVTTALKYVRMRACQVRVTYERRGVVGTEAGVDGPGLPVLAQNLCVVGRVGFYQQT